MASRGVSDRSPNADSGFAEAQCRARGTSHNRPGSIAKPVVVETMQTAPNRLSFAVSIGMRMDPGNAKEPWIFRKIASRDSQHERRPFRPAARA
jgi:hypothetical protein